MKKTIQLILSGVLFLSTIIANAQISTSTGGAINVLPNSPTSNTNIGIGTTNPTAKLEIIGLPDGQIFASSDDRNKKSLILNAGGLVSGSPIYRMFKFFDYPKSNLASKSSFWFALEDRNDANRFRVQAETDGFTQIVVSNKLEQDVMKINDDGNDNITMTLPKANSFLGIGTSNFVDGTDTYRLAVKGAIRADRVKVYTTWADFVFEKNYKLPTLEEVEKQILLEGHLKDIPSAKEVEAKGIELGEMNKLLLQKVEELTLYVIALDKELKVVKCNLKKQ
jgi:hypothetical protein